MKNTLICACAMLAVALPIHADSSWKETRTVLLPSPDKKHETLLQPGQQVTHTLSFQLNDVPAHRYLRVIGGASLPEPFTKRGETLFRAAEYLIDDNLDSICRKHDRYSLYFKGENDAFERHAYYRIPGNQIKPGELTVTLPVVKKQDLKLDADGNFGLQIGLYYPKEGRNALDIYDEPDSLLFINVPEGSGKHQQLAATFHLPQPVACLFLQLGGTRFSGECWVEAPRFKQHRKQVCSIPFSKFSQRTDSINYWVGSNLATHSWPKWRLECDGKTVFEGTMFDRASNVADFYLPIPASVRNGADLTLSLLDEPHRRSLPYALRGLELIEEPARDFEVISVPRYVSKHASFGVLIETNQPDACIRVSANGDVSPAMQECRFKQPGLHVVEFRAGEAGKPVDFTFEMEGRKETSSVKQIIEKEAENIYISSGDEIYIDKLYSPYDYFFKWYHANRIGNWYQFRPSYQWSGFRIANPAIIRHYTQLLNEMKIPYAWQVEGRTLASSRINPSATDLASPMFRGKQAHENDGGYYYWGHFKYEGLFSDLAARNRPYGGIFAKHRPLYTDHGTFIHYDPKGVHDMADGARTFVSNLRYSKGESTRHTGPSTLFRYFYQAGYEWLGAEQMYGPEETILSSLRGASRAYHRPDYGTLHAMQWGSFPFTDPKHALRFYMSLAVAYMHGSSHMNTEEALWTDEYMNDRYSESGKAHLFAQHQMLDFIETHTRRGELRSNIAVIQGRNDAWKSFVRGNLWSQEGEKWKFDQANESYDLLKVFYPGNTLDACGPHGWFTATPYGTVDLLPIEASQEVMDQYKVMIFLGWNSYDAADFERIRQFVQKGGTLILSAAHLNEELQPDKPTRFPTADAVVRQLLGNDYRQLTDRTEIALGDGKIVYFPQAVYPADASLRTSYESAIRDAATETVCQEYAHGWMKEVPHVGFTVWDAGKHRTLYLLNADWKSEKEMQPATLVYGKHTFNVAVGRYRIETIHCADNLAVMPGANTTDVLSIDRIQGGWNVKVQTTGKDTLRCMNAITGGISERVISAAGITNLFIEE